MSSPLVQILTHRGLWVALGLGAAAWTAARQARRRLEWHQRRAAARADEDLEEAWADLVVLREEEEVFERFRRSVRQRLEVDVLELLPEDRVGEVLETGRALGRLINILEGEFDCALPPVGTTERLSLEEWFRIVVRNAPRPSSPA